MDTSLWLNCISISSFPLWRTGSLQNLELGLLAVEDSGDNWVTCQEDQFGGPHIS